MNFQEQFNHRLKNFPQDRFLNANTDLEHFALINYAFPVERLRPFIPTEFEIVTWVIDGKEQALMSAVPFVDRNFCFKNLRILGKYSFGQINFRVYVRYKGENCVWFLGTVLGSMYYLIPNRLWQMPWYYGNFNIETVYEDSRYEKYKIEVKSKMASSRIDLIDKGEEFTLAPGFSSMEEMKLIMTQPLEGCYLKRNKNIGSYRIWHGELKMKIANAKDLYFQLFEDLKLLNKEEMQKPHSVWITPKTFFEVELPPKELKLI